MRRVLILVPLGLGLVMVGGVLLPRPWFYRHRRPTRLGRATNRFMGWLSYLGLPPSWAVALEVRGRRTGRLCATALVVGEYEGQRYLVSMLGERSEWVRNVRAAGGEAVLRHGSRERVRLEEVPTEERAPILHAYLQRAVGARSHIPVQHDAPAEEFARVAAEYPVFRMIGDRS